MKNRTFYTLWEETFGIVLGLGLIGVFYTVMLLFNWLNIVKETVTPETENCKNMQKR